MNELDIITNFIICVESLIGPFIGFSTGLTIIPILRSLDTFLARLLLGLTLSILSFEMAIILNTESFESYYYMYDLPAPNDRLETFVTGFIGGLLLFLSLSRWGAPAFETAKIWATRRSRFRDLSPIGRKDASRILPNAPKFNPLKFFGKKDYTYGGIDLDRKFVGIPDDLIEDSHSMFVGGSGGGKTTLITALAIDRQIKGKNDALLIGDSKPDRHLLPILSYFAKKLGKTLHVVDFESQVPTLNLFNEFNRDTHREFSEFALEATINSVYGMSDDGSDAAFYRGTDRDYARLFITDFALTSDSLKKAVEQFLSEHPDAEKQAKKFVSDIKEMTTINCLNASVQHALNIGDAIENGDWIYFFGSTDNSRILTAQRLTLACIGQYAKYRSTNSRRAYFILDEFASYNSAVSVNYLATLRSSKLLFWLGFQSFGDLANCPKNVNVEYAKSSLISNARLKFIFNTEDADTVEYLERYSGTRNASQETSIYEVNSGLSEVKKNVQSVTSILVPEVSANYFLELKKLTYFIFGIGSPQIAFNAPIIIPEDELFDINEYRLKLRQKAPQDVNNGYNPGSLIDVD